jgi:hypothetical protein
MLFFLSQYIILQSILTIYAPMINTAMCITFWMRAYPLPGEVGGGWALEFSSFLGPVKWHRANRRVRFRSPIDTKLSLTLRIFSHATAPLISRL